MRAALRLLFPLIKTQNRSLAGSFAQIIRQQRQPKRRYTVSSDEMDGTPSSLAVPKWTPEQEVAAQQRAVVQAREKAEQERLDAINNPPDVRERRVRELEMKLWMDAKPTEDNSHPSPYRLWSGTKPVKSGKIEVHQVTPIFPDAPRVGKKVG